MCTSSISRKWGYSSDSASTKTMIPFQSVRSTEKLLLVSATALSPSLLQSIWINFWSTRRLINCLTVSLVVWKENHTRPFLATAARNSNWYLTFSFSPFVPPCSLGRASSPEEPSSWSCIHGKGKSLSNKSYVRFAGLNNSYANSDPRTSFEVYVEQTFEKQIWLYEVFFSILSSVVLSSSHTIFDSIRCQKSQKRFSNESHESTKNVCLEVFYRSVEIV